MTPVLLLAFRRWQNIDKILENCRSAGVSRIYIHFDAGKNSREEADVSKALEYAFAYRDRWGLDLRIAKQTQNIGCAASMILSIDEILLEEESIIVLEDDCIPSLDFFSFMDYSFRKMSSHPQIAISCGAQFAPEEITQGRSVISRYPLNWGWGVTKFNWELVSKNLISRDKLKYRRGSGISRAETTYWNAGSRRAIRGFTDVWDTLLVREMLRLGFYSMLPPNNLVLNVGDDEPALHTRKGETRVNYPVGRFLESEFGPIASDGFEKWIRKYLFGISKRHLLSTKLTFLMDFFIREPKLGLLSERIQNASVNFDL
jgi:hypothetical protein